MPIEQAVMILRRLGFTAEHHGERIIATAPWWRSDIAHPFDLVEEIVRIAGYNRIPPLHLPTLPPAQPPATAWAQEEQLRDHLCAWGYDEAILDSFVLESSEALLDYYQTTSNMLVRVANPPAGSDILRPALLPNLLNAVRYLPLLAPQRRLYEIGRVFHQTAQGPQDRRAIAWMLVQTGGVHNWLNDEREPLYRLKAEALAILHLLGATVAAETSGNAPYPFSVTESVCLRAPDGVVLGYVGALDAKAYGTTAAQAAYGVELLLPPPHLPELASRTRRPVERTDISLLLNGVTPSQIQHLINAELAGTMVEISLIDLYAGDQLQPISATYRVIYAARLGAPREVWVQLRERIEAQSAAQVRG